MDRTKLIKKSNHWKIYIFTLLTRIWVPRVCKQSTEETKIKRIRTLRVTYF